MNNPSIFSINNVTLPKEFDYPNWRLTLDESRDLELFEKIYKDLDVQKEPLFFHQIREHLIKNPHIAKINQKIATKWMSNKSLVEEISKATILNNFNENNSI